MKEIKAYIKPQKLHEVTTALHYIENLTGVSIVEVKEVGRSRTKNGFDQNNDEWIFYASHVKIEIVCLDEMVKLIVSAIQKRRILAFAVTKRFMSQMWMKCFALKQGSVEDKQCNWM